jgi:uroporphyrinogen-III synthase
LGRVLYPCGNIARPTIPEALRRCGASVDSIVVYETVDATPSAVTRKLIGEGVDVIVFCSPSAVRRFVALGLSEGDATIACIGPTTASAARSAGLNVEVMAENNCASGMTATLERHYSAMGAAT